MLEKNKGNNKETRKFEEKEKLVCERRMRKNNEKKRKFKEEEKKGGKRS